MSEVRENKSGIIQAASKGPLAFFALIVLVAEIGLGVTVNLVKDNPTAVLSLIIGIVTLLIIMVIIVGLRFANPKPSILDFPGHGALLGERAVKGYFEGGDTKKLPGRWKVEWFEYDKTGKPKPYTVKDPDTGEEMLYPPDIVTVKVNQSLLSVEAHDQTTKRIYFLEGRISTGNTVTLQYWSQPGTDETILVGVLLLQVNYSFKDVAMKGTWSGYTRIDQIVHGTVSWTKLTID